jgi:hypothetical protein
MYLPLSASILSSGGSMGDSFFTSVDWLSPFRERTPEELAMDYTLRNDPDMPRRLITAVEAWCVAVWQQPWAEVYEHPAEIPTAYPYHRFGYRVCVRMPAYPSGTWIDVLVAADASIVGMHHVTDHPAWYANLATLPDSEPPSEQ